MSFGDRLREARKATGISQEELAFKLDLTQGAVARWENNRGFPETVSLVPMTKILGISLNWLFEVDNISLAECKAKARKVKEIELLRVLTESLENESLSENHIGILFDLINEFKR